MGVWVHLRTLRMVLGQGATFRCFGDCGFYDEYHGLGFLRTWKKSHRVLRKVNRGFPTMEVLFSYRVKGWECLFVLILVDAGIFSLHAIPVGILRPWKKKCLAERGILT
ncbi:hypothetical protein L1987_05511 [Smallanthus sonchifolius]|uniref:Uncharacterized protein n=1 Tax=Smallanthus sonchifolius TaxID=185202 RepID=A0ACB9JVK7_9ASTR|nr:hypothetical protein L1987_05511 [Smallanthus sonchifolius]